MLPFKEKIKAEVNLEGFTLEEKKELIEKLEENIVAKINLVIMETLPDEDREEFFRISEKPHSVAIEKFLKSRIPDISDLIAKSANDIIKEFNKLREE